MKTTSKIARMLATGALIGGLSAGAHAQSFTLLDGQVSPGESEVTLSWEYTAGASVSGIGIFFNFDTAVLTARQTTPPTIDGCVGGDASGLPIALCEEPGVGDDEVSLGLSNLFNPMGDLTPGGSITFDLANPAAEGDPPIVISVTLNEAGVTPGGTPVTVDSEAEITVVAGPAPTLTVEPASIDFGNVISPGTASDTATISNTGEPSSVLSVDGVSISGDPQFTITGGSCGATPFDLNEGESCTVDLQFSADAVQGYAGSLDVTAGAASDSVALTGTGTAGPVASFAISPPDATFGQVDLNDFPQSIVHTVTNDGDPGSTLELTSVTLGGTPEFSLATDCPATLAQGASCTVTVTFDSAVVGGPFADTVTAVTNVGTFEVPVSGEAVAQAVLDVNPPFGPVSLGQGPAGTIITANGAFSNTGSAAGDVTCNITGPDAAIFTATPSAGTIPAGGTVGFELACRLPDVAEQGDEFFADLNCSSPDDLTFDGTHNLSCGVQEFQSIPVPTMQPWALVLFSMLMLIAGGIGIRFFRAS